MASGSGDTNMQTPHDALQPVRDVIRQAVDRLVLVENNQVTMTSQIAAAMNLIDDNRKKSEAEVIEYLGKMKEEGTNRFAAIKKQEEQFESDIKHTQQVTSDWVKKIMAEKTETIDALSQDVQMQRQKDSKDVENHVDILKIEIAIVINILIRALVKNIFVCHEHAKPKANAPVLRLTLNLAIPIPV